MSSLPRTPLSAALILLGLLGSCSSTDLYSANRNELAAATKSIEAGQYQAAATRMEKMLAKTGAEAGTYRAQRYFGAYLLATAHLLASFEGSFLTEVGQANRSTIGGGGSERDASPIGHLVAAMYYTDYAEEWRPAKGGLKEGDEPLVPAALAELGMDGVRDALGFSRIAVYSRLHFQDPISNILAGSASVTELQACEALLDGCSIDARVRPWVYLAVFEHLRKVDEISAYPFGVRALATASDAGGTVDATQLSAISRWMTTDASFRFLCPSCRQEVIPDLPRCAQCNRVDIIDFRAEARPAAD